MDKIDVKKDMRYVAAMMSDVPMFISREVNTGMHFSSDPSQTQTLRFALTDNIATALKATDKDTMREVIRQYGREHSIKTSFTILPIEISYRIVDYEG